MKKNIKDSSFTIRLSEEDKLLLEYCARLSSRSPSHYIRMLIDSCILPLKLKIRRGELTYEYIETFLNNFL